MKNLVIMKERQAVTTSLMIAEVFEKRHSHVIDAIENKIRSAENSADYNSMFYEGKYVDKSNREQKLYYMNRDGFTFIAFGFTGKEADTFKLQYIKAFNTIEKSLKISSNPSLRLATLTSELLDITTQVNEDLESVKTETEKHGNDIKELKYNSEITDEQASVITDMAKDKVRSLIGYPSVYYQKVISDLYRYLKRHHYLGSKIRTTKKGNYNTVLTGIRTYNPELEKLMKEHDEYMLEKKRHAENIQRLEEGKYV